MNLHIKIPTDLEQALKLKAAAAGKDIETYVVDSLLENLTNSSSNEFRTTSDFHSWLDETRKLIPVNLKPVDDSRDSIYAESDK